MIKLSGLNILIVSPEPWNHIFVSKHHYAVELALSNQVYFLNPPERNWSLSKTSYPNLSELVYKGFWKGLSKLPKRIRLINQKQVFGKLESLAEVRFDIIWSFDNSVFFDFDALPASLIRISHIVDLKQDFQTKKAASSADICFGVIPEVVKRQKKYNPKSFLMPHAVRLSETNHIIQLPGINKYKALYFGNLEMPDLHWELINQVTSINQQIDFIFLGPMKAESHYLESRDNTHHIPAVPHQELANYMEAADILFLFHTRSYLSNFASPHKLLEYLSSGKPILSTYIPEYVIPREVYYLAESIEDWTNKLRLALNENSHKTADIRRNYALTRTYASSLKAIEGLINTHVMV